MSGYTYVDSTEYDLIENECGFYSVNPIPPEEELSEFYQSKYPELLADGNMAPDVDRLLREDNEKGEERTWRRSTWYPDHLSLAESAADRECERLLDVGCGNGEFVSFAADMGYDALGVEPSGRIADAALQRGLDVYQGTVEEFTENRSKIFDVVTLFNVLEHVPDPERTLKMVWSLLASGGVVVVKVPNEFNPFQVAARDSLGLDKWWVTIPAHLHYFDLSSITALGRRCGFDPVTSFADFPMSLFLLMGHNYVANDNVGAKCHRWRVQFERSISDDQRRTFYNKISEAGVGRNCTIVARKPRSDGN